MMIKLKLCKNILKHQNRNYLSVTNRYNFKNNKLNNKI